MWAWASPSVAATWWAGVFLCRGRSAPVLWGRALFLAGPLPRPWGTLGLLVGAGWCLCMPACGVVVDTAVDVDGWGSYRMLRASAVLPECRRCVAPDSARGKTIDHGTRLTWKRPETAYL